MIRDFNSKNNSSRLILQRRFFGIGIGIDFYCAITHREVLFNFHFDLIGIRFWWTRFKIIENGKD
jgi:hypothetical protein